MLEFDRSSFSRNESTGSFVEEFLSWNSNSEHSLASCKSGRNDVVQRLLSSRNVVIRRCRESYFVDGTGNEGKSFGRSLGEIGTLDDPFVSIPTADGEADIGCGTTDGNRIRSRGHGNVGCSGSTCEQVGHFVDGGKSWINTGIAIQDELEC